jgi:hypothetical protein
VSLRRSLLLLLLPMLLPMLLLLLSLPPFAMLKTTVVSPFAIHWDTLWTIVTKVLSA